MTTEQVRQLVEIDEARGGIRDEVQELIARLTSGGVGSPDTTDPFLVQSKVLWDRGWGRELGYGSLDAYRQGLELEGLPLKPERPAGMPEHLNRLVLWDRRPLLVKGDGKERVSLAKACRLCGVAYDGDDDTLVQQEGTPEIEVPVRWVWCQDGRRRSRGRRPSDCRESFKLPEVGLEALGGLCLHAQDATVIGGAAGVAWYVMNLPGSVHCDNPSSCACLELWGGRPELSWSRGGGAFPRYGSASRWE